MSTDAIRSHVVYPKGLVKVTVGDITDTGVLAGVKRFFNTIFSGHNLFSDKTKAIATKWMEEQILQGQITYEKLDKRDIKLLSAVANGMLSDKVQKVAYKILVTKSEGLEPAVKQQRTDAAKSTMRNLTKLEIVAHYNNPDKVKLNVESAVSRYFRNSSNDITKDIKELVEAVPEKNRNEITALIPKKEASVSSDPTIGSKPTISSEPTISSKPTISSEPTFTNLLKELTKDITAKDVNVSNVAQAYIPTLTRLAEIKETHPKDYELLFSTVKESFHHDIAATERGFTLAGSVTNAPWFKSDANLKNALPNASRENPVAYMDPNMTSDQNTWAARSLFSRKDENGKEIHYLCRRKPDQSPNDGQYMVKPAADKEEYRTLVRMTPGVEPKVLEEHEDKTSGYIYYNLGNPFQTTKYDGRGALGLPGNSMAVDVGFVFLDSKGLLTFFGGSRAFDLVTVLDKDGKEHKIKQNNLIGGMLEGDALTTADPTKAKGKCLTTCVKEFLEEGVSGSIVLSKEEEAEVQHEFETFKTKDIEEKIKKKIAEEEKDGNKIDDSRKDEIRKEITANPKHPAEKLGQLQTEAKLKKMDKNSPKTSEILKKIAMSAEDAYQGPVLRDGRNTNRSYMETTAFTSVFAPLTLARTGICQIQDPKLVQKEIEELEKVIGQAAPTPEQAEKLSDLKKEKADLENKVKDLLDQLKADYNNADAAKKESDFAFDPTKVTDFPYYMIGGDDMVDVKEQPLGAISANRGWHSHANLKTCVAAFAAATMLKNGSLKELTPVINEQFVEAGKIHKLRVENDNPICDGAPIPAVKK
jgi:hypothetical protein